MTYSRLGDLHQKLLIGLFACALGAWGQSVSVKLPKLQWRAEQEQTLVRRASELEQRHREEAWCKRWLEDAKRSYAPAPWDGEKL